MVFSPARATLAVGTVVVATMLLAVVAIGLTAANSPAKVLLTVAALLALAAAMLEPYRLLRLARP